MNTDKYIKKQVFYSIIFIIIGLIAGLIGFVFHFQKNIMIGLACGFTPTGIGLLLVYNHAKKNPKLIKNIELEKEERNIFINCKAAQTAFWITYWYIFIAVMLSNFVNVSLNKFGIFTIFFMPIVYFGFVFTYHKKY